MLKSKFQQAKGEGGFTLIELLVVILIIGILAAIALPTFLGQSDKAKDSAAKSNARNLVSQVESCAATKQTYVGCDTVTALGKTGLPVVAAADLAAGKVAVTATGTDTYTIVAESEANGNTFTITKNDNGEDVRSCTGSDGCDSSSW